MLAILPAILRFKVDIKAGTDLHSEYPISLNITAKREFKAGDSIPVLFFNGPAILSVETVGTGSGTKPSFSAFLDKANTNYLAAISDAWRIVNEHVGLLTVSQPADAQTNINWVTKAIEKMRIQDNEGAVADCDKAIAANPNNEAAYNLRGYLKIKLSQYTDAIKDFDSAIAINQKYFIAFNCRGYAYYELGGSKANYRKAIEDYDVAIQLGGGSYVPKFKYRDDAIAAIDKINKPEGEIRTNATIHLTTEDWLNKAVEKIDNKDFQGAVLCYDQAIILNPKLAAAYNGRGVAKDQLHHYNDAILDLDKAIVLDTTHASYYFECGLVKDNVGRYSEAIADYDRAIALDPKDDGSYYWRGFAKCKIEHYGDAIADYDRVILLSSKYTVASYNLRGYAYYKLGGTKTNYRKAIADFDMAIQLGGSSYKHDYKYRDDAVAFMDKATGP